MQRPDRQRQVASAVLGLAGLAAVIIGFVRYPSQIQTMFADQSAVTLRQTLSVSLIVLGIATVGIAAWRFTRQSVR